MAIRLELRNFGTHVSDFDGISMLGKHVED